MKTLQIDEKKARKLYKTASEEFKTTMEDTFGKEFFSEDITKRVNSYEDSLEENGQPDVTNFGDVPEKYVPVFRAFWRNLMIVEALNEGEQMDIYDSSKRRHYPYMIPDGSPSAFRFGGSVCGSMRASAGSGSRLSLKREKLSNHYGKVFTKEIQDFLTK